MNPSQFSTLGQALFGPQWQRALARALNIGERQVRHYAAGTRPMPADMSKRIATLLYGQIETLTALAKRIKL